MRRRRRRKFATIEFPDFTDPVPSKGFEDTHEQSESVSPDGIYKIIRTISDKLNEDGEPIKSVDYYPIVFATRVDFIDGEVSGWQPIHWDANEWVFRSLAKARLLAEAHSAYGKAGITELYAARERRRIRAKVARQTK
jgi:hypothetical protein